MMSIGARTARRFYSRLPRIRLCAGVQGPSFGPCPSAKYGLRLPLHSRQSEFTSAKASTSTSRHAHETIGPSPAPTEGGRRAAAISSLIATAKLNDVDPQAKIADALAHVPDHSAERIDELLPWIGRSKASLTQLERDQPSRKRPAGAFSGCIRLLKMRPISICAR